MHTTYLLFAFIIMPVLALAAFQVVLRSVPELRGIRQLVGFLLCAMAAMVLLASQSRIPPFFGVVLGNYLLLVGPLFLYAAAADILRLRLRHLPWMVAVAAAGFPALLWGVYVDRGAVARLTVHAVVVGILFSATAVILFRHRDEDLRLPMRTCAWSLIALSSLQVVWVIYHLVSHRPTSFAHPDPADEAFSYLSLLLGMGNIGALAWLALSEHRRELHHVAQTDSLTGLLNRGAFEDVLRRELLRARRSDSAMAVMMIDIDYFKQVNDSYGHMVGDLVLRRIAETLRQGTRPSDVLARYGGEEFVILLREAGLEAAEAAAERIRLDIATLTDLPENVTMTVSIGVAANHEGETSEGFLLRADEALYRSKREGRNLVTVHRQPRRNNVVSM
ncbi:MAG TPA: GGDEF domain-containing protein [Acidobacteriaceae bacterium]|nr:GGDEF domain-containing protein [Acidobacteriaceae bacterium]